MKRVFMTIVGVIAIAIMATAQGNGDWRRYVSREQQDVIHSKVLNADRNYTVYLPAGYDADTTRRYPVLYLLHGMSDTDRRWYDRGHLKDVADQLIASGEAEPMIIITPDAGGNPAEKQNGYFNMKDWPYEDFFFTEFLPEMESRYRIKSDRGSRAVAGLSMGGGGATSYAQRHSDMFSACYAMSALQHLPAPDPNKVVAGDKTAILTDAVNKLSCVDYVVNADEDTKKALRTVDWYIDCGDDDFLLDCNIDLVRAMRKAWIPCQFRVRDGGHTWDYWHSALYEALPFVSRKFLRSAAN